MGRARQWNLLRDRGGERRVTNMELFFDLVFVFAVTQLSQYLLQHRTVTGALKTGLLLTMVWLLWAYTTWVTNWLDPGRIPVRLLLLALMLISLVMSAALPQAFRASGLLVAAPTPACRSAAAHSPSPGCKASRCSATTSASWPGAS